MKNKRTFEQYDTADYIETPEDVAMFLEEAMAENDPEFLLQTIGHIARSKGMAALARELNVDRAGLYKSLAPDGNPYFFTVVRVLDALGLRIKIERKVA